jgi:hypothetical protein
VKTFAFASFLSICATVHLFAQPPGYDVYQEKRFVMEFRSEDQVKVLGVELVIAKPADEERTPMELLERQGGARWWGFGHGDVYRFDPASRKWELIMGRDLGSTETVVGGESRIPRAGLKISELQGGDLIICRGTWAQ